MSALTDPTRFDDVDWHIDSALAAGVPEENAGAHIGIYLGWLIRRGLHNPEFFTDEWVDAVQKRDMSGSEVLDALDGKLDSDLMTDDAASFTAWYYDIYLSDFDHHFGHRRAYTIVDDQTAQDLIEPVLDGRYKEWVGLGRPDAGNSQPIPTESEAGFGPQRPVGGLSDQYRELVEAEVASAGHESPTLEELIPASMTDPPMRVHSVPASKWGNLLLIRALKRLGLPPNEATVATGIGGRGKDVVTVTLYAIPRQPADRLWAEIPVLAKQPGATCSEREVAARTVLWCARPEFLMATWAVDGIIVAASAQDPQRLQQLIEQLP
jgi:hypothetical protein